MLMASVPTSAMSTFESASASVMLIADRTSVRTSLSMSSPPVASLVKLSVRPLPLPPMSSCVVSPIPAAVMLMLPVVPVTTT